MDERREGEMKLGRLIRRGMTSRKRPAARGPVRRKRVMRAGTPFFAKTGAGARSSVNGTSLPGRESRERVAELRPTSPAVVPAEVVPTEAAPAVRSAFEKAGTGTLLSADLLRPDDRLRKCIESFLMDQRSPHTRRAYGKDLKRFVGYLIGRKARAGSGFAMERIDRSVVIGYKNSLLDEALEHTTIDRHLSTLRSFFRWLVEEEILARNPAETVRFLNPKRISRTIGASDEEVVRLLKQPNLHTRTGSQHYAILVLLFYCGLRRAEVCELRTTNLGKERGQRVLRLRGKGNSERIIAVIPAVERALAHYFRITGRKLEADAPLFSPIRNNRTGEREKPLDPSMIFYIVTKYARRAGITNRISPHSCRATAISNARDHNVPDRVIQEFAGWANPDMITRYDKRKAAVKDSAAHAIRYGDSDRDFPG